MSEDVYQLLLEYSLKILARKSYTGHEMMQRLIKRGKRQKFSDSHFKTAVAKVLERLRELKYIDDAEFIENYLEYHLPHRPLGKFAFLHEMHRRGITLDEARRRWEKRGIEEKTLAKELLQRRKQKFEAMPLVLRKKKIAMFLAGRGFAPETVWAVLDGIHS